MSEEKTLKQLLSELIESLDYFRLLTNNEQIIEKLTSIDNKLTALIDLFSDTLKKGYLQAKIKPLKEGEEHE